MHRNKVFAAMLAILMVVSLTACGRESVGTPGGELENGVAAIEDAMTTKPNESSSASTTPIDDLRNGSSTDTVATPGDFPDAYNYGSGKISDYSRTAMLQKMPEPAGNNTVLNTAADPVNIQVLYLWEEGNVPARTKFTQDMTGYFDDWNFRPYVTAIPVRDGVKPKGAVVLMAGGAYQFRGNYTDSLPTAAALRELGFQTFIVDYRLSPYTQEEGALDVARAVRFIRKNAEVYGIDPDNIAVMGFSAGGIQAGEFLMHYDEDVTGTALDSTYVPDELDAVPAHASAAGMIYSFYGRLSVGNMDESKIILVDGVHEPIVSKETFAKAAERLKKNVAHRKTRSDSTTVYPLTGLIRCPDCGKNIFGYTAPPRKKKNGKEGYYPRYISYRCISGRDRNGINCSLANKYYSGTKLETEVKEVISSMVTIPEFVELISQKIDIQTDVNSLRKKRAAIQNEITKYNGNLLQTEKRLTELDIADRHYQSKVDSLNRILDDLYEKIEDAQTRLDEVNQEITMVEKSAMTKKSIFEMLEGFSKYYDVMSPEDKKALLQAMVSFIELYPEKRDDKHLIKTIHFTFPVTYDGESGALFVRTNEQQVETVCLMSRKEK